MPNDSTASFDTNEMLGKMVALSAQMQATPNAFVTTSRSLVLLRKTLKHQEQEHFTGAVSPEHLAIAGINFIECATVKDCLDRMMEPRKGERLKLILMEDIPVECIDHPWIKKQVSEMGDRMGLGWMQVK